MTTDFYNNLSDLRHTKDNIQKIQLITQTITELQKERGLSSGYLANNSQSLYRQLQKQRLKTDERVEKLYKHSKQAIQQFPLLKIRNQVDTHIISSCDEFSLYTDVIKNLFKKYLFIVNNIQNSSITKKFAPLTSLLVIQESLGELRGSMNGIFAKKALDAELVYFAMHAKGQYDIAKDRYETIAPNNFKQQFLSICSSKECLWMNEQVHTYLILKSADMKVNPTEWFRKTTHVITQISKLTNEHIDLINQAISTLHQKYLQKMLFNIVVFIVVTVIMLLLGVQIKKNILEKISLLKQYKDIVDRNSIVSKTDIHGRITYVNDQFCSISGYTKKELIGKPHNIVRHQDMPKDAFKDMWKTILNKKPWYGIVKNRKKDGSSYTVEATINPILDSDGNIIEFIALRNDITDIIKLHEEIEKTQEEIILRMGEIGETRSQETGFHVKRVASYSEILARHYGLDEVQIRNLTIASPMHDIGKVAIPDSILNKPGKLTTDEWKVIQTHAEVGYRLFKDSKRELLKTAAIIAYEHHEKYDGTGYPRGLSGEDIHIYGRITAIADVFDALGSERCYKKAWDDERIFNLFKEERGKHFDPKLVDIFFEHLSEFLAIRDKYNQKSAFMRED